MPLCMEVELLNVKKTELYHVRNQVFLYILQATPKYANYQAS